MAQKKEKTEIEKLKDELNELIIYNPTFGFSDRAIEKKKYISFYLIISFFVAIFIGFGIASTGLQTKSEGTQVFPQVYIITQFTLMIVVPFLLYILGLINVPLGKKNINIGIVFIVLIIIIFSAVINMSSSESEQKELLSVILPYVNLGVVSLVYVYIFFSLSRTKQIKNSIIKQIFTLNKLIKKIQEDKVLKAHSVIDNKIDELKKDISQSSNFSDSFNKLLKAQSYNIWDILKLELITNSRNGINLIDNWEYIELSKRLIDKMMSDDNNYNKIVIVGDLSFLSTEIGVEMLVKSIITYKKVFSIYFTGEPEEGNNKVLYSTHCENLVNHIIDLAKNKKIDKTKINDDNIKLIPIQPNFFTGIGFIGLKNKNPNGNEPYKEVFSYVSSLISDETEDIFRVHPLTLKWNKKTNLFNNYLSTLQYKDLKVKINSENIKPGNIFKTLLK